MMKEFRKIIRSVIIPVLLSIARSVSGSPQMPDYIVYKGDTIAVYNLILEQYLDAAGKSGGGSLFGLTFREGASSNCWRGYQAIYSIAHDSLFLNNIIRCGELRGGSRIDKKNSAERIRELFGTPGEKVFVHWFTGTVGLPDGDLLRWDGVFHRSFEKEILIRVDRGRVADISRVANYVDDPRRLDRRYRDTVSNVLFEELEKVRWKNVGKFDCSERYEITIGKKGRVRSVSMPDYPTKEEIDQFWGPAEYNYCIRTIHRELRDLRFDIMKMNGDPIEERVPLEIWVEEDGALVNWTD